MESKTEGVYSLPEVVVLVEVKLSRIYPSVTLNFFLIYQKIGEI